MSRAQLFVFGRMRPIPNWSTVLIGIPSWKRDFHDLLVMLHTSADPVVTQHDHTN